MEGSSLFHTGHKMWKNLVFFFFQSKVTKENPTKRLFSVEAATMLRGERQGGPVHDHDDNNGDVGGWVTQTAAPLPPRGLKCTKKHDYDDVTCFY